MKHTDKLFLESLALIEFSKKSSFIKLIKDPVTTNIPLLVKDKDDLSMNDIASGMFLPSANLSIMAQKLYNCISGKKFILDDDDFPDFSKAIEYSINTDGLWCYKTLKKKSSEFNKDKPNILETYLRITIGENSGESYLIKWKFIIFILYYYKKI